MIAICKKLGLACLIMGATILMTSDADAKSMARPVLSLKCIPSDTSLSNSLCKAVERELRAAAGAFVLRRLRPDESAPSRSQDLATELHITYEGNDPLSARLDWRIGDAAITERGDELSLAKVGSDTPSESLKRLASDLVTSLRTHITGTK